MGSGRSNQELTSGAKKPRERRRREATQKKRLLALGVPADRIAHMTSQAVRRMLQRPAKVRAQWAPKPKG